MQASPAQWSLRRVAIVHDWLVVKGGAERVLHELLSMFPHAELFCTVCFLAEKDRDLIAGRKLTTTFIQRLPGAAKRYRSYLPLMPIAIEQLDLSAFDLVISSSYAVAKGVLTGPDQVHVSYVHSPARYAWDLQHSYLRETGLARGFKSAIARLILHYIRIWDSRTAAGVDVFIANSAFVARRIRKTYGRDAVVVPPPVDLDYFVPAGQPRQDFYLTASRMVPYKETPLIVEAFTRTPERNLVVIGDGPEMPAVRTSAAQAPNITILGFQPNAVLLDYMQRARALVFAAQEDFGIIPLEAQACGTPVIAFGRGGALETVIGEGPRRTGVFFPEQSVEAIIAATNQFEKITGVRWEVNCRRNAESFSTKHFRSGITDVLATVCPPDMVEEPPPARARIVGRD